MERALPLVEIVWGNWLYCCPITMVLNGMQCALSLIIETAIESIFKIIKVLPDWNSVLHLIFKITLLEDYINEKLIFEHFRNTEKSNRRLK
ncbi:hypothetical protein FNW52_16825 [Flavobacterium sp. ZT3R18]|uniref:hypothetical protein n=1 Tax=Flavobacterium sp. ZT3R18 TaxID=2594429 RepID=UPI00117A4531|nr:hypothetical protein [Flavobacterium sp. ZT3R18]TRX32550.1 hypothetical protein FNW52_16825 [Flavobacterium sp. ZT3R18]